MANTFSFRSICLQFGPNDWYFCIKVEYYGHDVNVNHLYRDQSLLIQIKIGFFFITFIL